MIGSILMLCSAISTASAANPTITFHKKADCSDTEYGKWISDTPTMNLDKCNCAKGAASGSAKAHIKLMCTSAKGNIISSYSDASCKKLSGTSQMKSKGTDTQEK